MYRAKRRVPSEKTGLVRYIAPGCTEEAQANFSEHKAFRSSSTPAWAQKWISSEPDWCVKPEPFLCLLNKPSHECGRTRGGHRGFVCFEGTVYVDHACLNRPMFSGTPSVLHNDSSYRASISDVNRRYTFSLAEVLPAKRSNTGAPFGWRSTTFAIWHE